MKVLFLETALILATFSSGLAKQAINQTSLRQMHVLFRNGERTPYSDEIYPKDPYKNMTYSPFGLGQLTMSGRKKVYRVGQSLRKHFGMFLGEYRPEDFYGRSIEADVSITSMELALAGIYPPKGQQVWNKKDFPKWQPIPFHIDSLKNDLILQPTNCPFYKTLLEQKDNSSKQQKQYAKYKNTFSYISKNSGLNVTNFESGYHLYFVLKGEENWGLNLPQWTKIIWPEKLEEIIKKYYFETTAKPEMKKIVAGYFLQKIIRDMENRINGTASEDSGNKLNLYSGHQLNIAHVLIVLGLFSKPHIPKYGAHLVFELHQKNSAYGVKIRYHANYPKGEMKLLKLNGCKKFCPIDKFKDLLKDVLPSNGVCTGDLNKKIQN